MHVRGLAIQTAASLMSRLSGLLPVLWPSFRDLSLSLHAIQCSKKCRRETTCIQAASQTMSQYPQSRYSFATSVFCQSRERSFCQTKHPNLAAHPHNELRIIKHLRHTEQARNTLHGVTDASPALKFFPLLTSTGKGINSIVPSKSTLRQGNLCQVHQPWHGGDASDAWEFACCPRSSMS